MDIEHCDPGEYRKWVRRLGAAERANIHRRLVLLHRHGIALGLPNVKRLELGIWELRSGKYRLYFVIEADVAKFVTYGEKDTQQRDIRRAQERTQ